MIRGAHYQDPSLFSSELVPSFGHSIKQGIGDFLLLFNQFLGDQWKIGNWEGMMKAAPELAMMARTTPDSTEPPQNMKEYDPEWGRVFADGSVGASCNHAQMLSQVKCPVLFTHHFRSEEPTIMHDHHFFLGAISDVQAKSVGELITAAGQQYTYKSFPEMGHIMHDQDPELFVKTIREWASTLPSEADVKKSGALTRMFFAPLRVTKNAGYAGAGIFKEFVVSAQFFS